MAPAAPPGKPRCWVSEGAALAGSRVSPAAVCAVCVSLFLEEEEEEEEEEEVVHTRVCTICYRLAHQLSHRLSLSLSLSHTHTHSRPATKSIC